ncbi:hypothetical protein, partial [Endozoicomonas sp. ALB060]|uniref:hypothetical protein n=1 Tax=Endozoicomonas sp. ALB060 TaxID=3403072 RepID=UPI003BB4AB6E
MVRSLLLLVTMLFGDSLQALELVGSSPLPAYFLYSNKLAEPEQPDPLRGCHELTPVIPGLIPVIPGLIPVIPGLILVIPGFILVIPAKAGIHT